MRAVQACSPNGRRATRVAFAPRGRTTGARGARVGNGLQQLQDGTFGTYSAAGLGGEGRIAGRRVDFLAPDLQIRFHRGYPPDDDDRHDVRMLVERFDLPLPPQYLDTPP